MNRQEIGTMVVSLSSSSALQRAAPSPYHRPRPWPPRLPNFTVETYIVDEEESTTCHHCRAISLDVAALISRRKTIPCTLDGREEVRGKH